MTLTSQDVRAIRSADSVVFRLYNGEATIEAIRDGDKTADGFEQKHVVFVGSSVVDYGRDHTWQAGDKYSCFAHEGAAQYSQTWPSIAAQLKVGDEVTL